jgi:hypothetical protein
VRVVFMGIGMAALGALVTVLGAGAAVGGSDVIMRAGITATVPPGWRVVDRRLTPCTDPAGRLTLVGHRAMVMLQERLAGARGFPPRPHRFELRGQPAPMECCAPLARAGWLVSFGDNGRGFYAYVYPGAAGTRAETLTVLDSLRIRRSPR